MRWRWVMGGPGMVLVILGATAAPALQVRVVDAVSRRPLAGAVVAWRIGDATHSTILSGVTGKVKVPVSGKAGGPVRVTASKHGFAPMTMWWDPGKVPAKFDLPLPEAQTIGGRVAAESGKPVGGANITLNLPQRLSGPRVAVEEFAVRSEADGRWRCEFVPKDAAYVFVEVSHPDFDSPGGEASLEALRAGVAEFKVYAVATVRGRVLDDTGRTVPDAELMLGRERDIWPSSSTVEARTDGEGRFEFRRVRLEKRLLGAHATGFAPALQLVEIKREAAPVEVRLKPGTPLRVRVVDHAGQPIAGVEAKVNEWPSGIHSGGDHLPCRWAYPEWAWETDADGRFTWSNAPPEIMTVELRVDRQYSSQPGTMVMKNGILLVVSSLVLTLCSLNQIEAGQPKVGAKPPPLQLARLLQAPADTHASWDALKGKVVVLEFWATWCGPCVAAIPHLNELADEFKDRPVQFIAITDEDEKVVSPFLKRKPIHAWIGLDTDKSMHKDYAISGIPHTVVIDRKGKVAAITYPTVLTKQHLSDVLAGRRLALAEPKRERDDGFRPGELPQSAQQGREALFQVLIRPSDASNHSAGSSQGNITSLGCTVLDMLSSSYSINPVRIITNVVLPEDKYDVLVKTLTKENDVAAKWLRPAVESTFGLNASRETREMEVYVLTAIGREATKLTPTVSTGGSSSSSGPGRMQAINVSIAALAGSLEFRLKKPVLDETKLTERYDFELKWEAKDPEHPDFDTLAKAVREQLGLELTPARRPVEVLVVDEAKKESNSRSVPARRVP